MNNPLISVIVPVYNVEKYLDRCVKSVVEQTYTNLEIILVDDGSPDNCPEMCDEWAKKDRRIKVVHQKNMGLIRARDSGLKAVTGEYVSFVDSDDWISADCIEYLYNLIVKSGADVSAADVYSTDSENVNVPAKNENIIEYDFQGVIKNISNKLCYLVCKLYKSELFKSVSELPDDIFFGEDTLRNYFIYKQCKSVCVSNLVKYFYFRHGEAGIAGKITYKLIDSSLKTYRIIDEDFDMSSPAYQYQLYNKILSEFFLLNSIIRNQLCLDRYDEIRNDILSDFKRIEDKSIVSKKHLYAIKLLKVSSVLYNLSINVRTKMRGY